MTINASRAFGRAAGYNINPLAGLPRISSGFNASAAGPDPNVNTPQLTLMQKLQPDKSYAPPAFNARQHTYDVQRPVKEGDLKDSREASAGTKEQVQNIKADFEDNFNHAQNIALETFKSVAQERGFDPGMAVVSVVPAGGPTIVGTAAGMAVDTAAPGAGAASIALDIAHSAKSAGTKLSRDDVESLIRETQSRLANPTPQEKEKWASLSPKGQASPDPQKFDFSNLEARDLEELLTAKPENQKEMQDLAAAEKEIEGVDLNHGLIEARWESGLKLEGETLTAAETEKKLEQDFEEIAATTSGLAELSIAEKEGNFQVLQLDDAILRRMAVKEPEPSLMATRTPTSGFGMSSVA